MVTNIIFFKSCLSLGAFILSQYVTCDAAQGVFYQKVKTGGSLLPNVLSNETVSSTLECSHRCLRIQNCTGFNHKSTKTRKEINCQLLDGEIAYIKQTVDSRKWTLYKTLKIRVVNQTTCPDGWLKLFSSCYYFESTRLTWDEARSACQSLGGDLFVPDDSTEQYEIWMLSQARTPPVYFPWIGVRLPQPNTNVFYTVHDVPISYSNWHSPEPNNLYLEFCVILYQDTDTWNNIPCNSLRDYICERDQTIVPLSTIHLRA